MLNYNQEFYEKYPSLKYVDIDMPNFNKYTILNGDKVVDAWKLIDGTWLNCTQEEQLLRDIAKAKADVAKEEQLERDRAIIDYRANTLINSRKVK